MAPRAGRSDNGAYRVGRRRSHPLVLALAALGWFGVGLAILVASDLRWHVVMGVVALGFGALYARGLLGVLAAPAMLSGGGRDARARRRR
jgi:hypothetical protein